MRNKEERTEKNHKTLVRLIGAPVNIQTGYLPNANPL
jgi:hypothetical protein